MSIELARQGKNQELSPVNINSIQQLLSLWVVLFLQKEK